MAPQDLIPLLNLAPPPPSPNHDPEDHRATFRPTTIPAMMQSQDRWTTASPGQIMTTKLPHFSVRIPKPRSSSRASTSSPPPPPRRAGARLTISKKRHNDREVRREWKLKFSQAPITMGEVLLMGKKEETMVLGNYGGQIYHPENKRPETFRCLTESPLRQCSTWVLEEIGEKELKVEAKRYMFDIVEEGGVAGYELPL